MRTLFCLLIITITVFKNDGQSYLSVQAHANYWKHTDVFGPGVGFGYSYTSSKIHYKLSYDYGYGSVNRFDNINNINYNNWTTVFINEQNGKWNEYLGFFVEQPNELKGKSDYGKQHQISLQLGYSLQEKENADLRISTGLFATLVEHFYTYQNVEIHNIELPLTYSGPLNYIPATSQKIYTYGLMGEVEWILKREKLNYAPYLVLGLGPNYGSYISIGLRMSTKLLSK